MAPLVIADQAQARQEAVERLAIEHQVALVGPDHRKEGAAVEEVYHRVAPLCRCIVVGRESHENVVAMPCPLGRDLVMQDRAEAVEPVDRLRIRCRQLRGSEETEESSEPQAQKQVRDTVLRTMGSRE